MITGLHAVIFSKDAARDRAFFKDVSKFPNVDVGQGWLILAAPLSEIAFHPSEDDNRHEIYLMCDNVEMEIKTLEQACCACSAIMGEDWGLLTSFTLPGEGTVGLYQPKHASPPRDA